MIPFSIVIILTVLERLCVLLTDEAAACDCAAADAAEVGSKVAAEASAEADAESDVDWDMMDELAEAI